MYSANFDKAKNLQGKLLRNPKTHDLQEYCMHSFMIYPNFEMIDELVAESFSYSRDSFGYFKGCCIYCGECIDILAENVVSKKEFERRINDYAKNACK